ncbi:hypothetical protein OOZ15_00955 [Galbibacter sp. EGI 63066]|uniref:hypothetical protein n=1 Tax=Galbibacter sp. EGI 63066 TaxID=2993559 RepID=UPI002248C7B5|nr:hypothetical protein [Galbibacter sp. EGI 63066]MCX2678498.1 hypothetical protein [Galbibacter sp. EGI 63066]
MNTKLVHGIVLLLCIGLIACSGEDGMEGPQGLQGEQGPAGPQGEQGPQGETGTANVRYSSWIPIDWNVLDANTVKRMDIDIPEITEEFIENGGIVLFYVRSTDSVWAVPMSRDNYSLYFLASSASQEIRFLASRITGLTGDINVSWILEVRYVLIFDGIPLQGEVSLNDYESLKEYYGITD